MTERSSRSSTDSTIQLLNDLTSASISRQRQDDVESSNWLGEGDVYHRFLFLRAMLRIGLPVSARISLSFSNTYTHTEHTHTHTHKRLI